MCYNKSTNRRGAFMKPYGFIYMTINLINNKKYIGQKKIDENYKWKTYLGSGGALKKSVAKYGKKNFKRVVIAEASNAEELNELEIEYINKHDAVSNREFYNLAAGGGAWPVMIGKENPFYGKTHSLEVIKKIQKANIGKLAWNKGKTEIYSKESLQKMSEAKKGIPLTKDHKLNIKTSQFGEKHPMYGKKHKEESKEKIRLKALGKKASIDTRKRMSEAQSGEKNHNFGKTGSKWHGSKNVICLTTGEKFRSIIEASEKYGCNRSDITQCCKGNRKSAGKLPDGTKLTWKYEV